MSTERKPLPYDDYREPTPTDAPPTMAEVTWDEMARAMTEWAHELRELDANRPHRCPERWERIRALFARAIERPAQLTGDPECVHVNTQADVCVDCGQCMNCIERPAVDVGAFEKALDEYTDSLDEPARLKVVAFVTAAIEARDAERVRADVNDKACKLAESQRDALRERAEKVTAERESIIAELRNYELNGSDAVKQIRGIYADADRVSHECRVLREDRDRLRAALMHYADGPGCAVAIAALAPPAQEGK